MKNLDDESFIGKTDYYIFCINDYIVDKSGNHYFIGYN